MGSQDPADDCLPWVRAMVAILAMMGLLACETASLTEPAPDQDNVPVLEVNDLSVEKSTDSSVVLAWTDVRNGAGDPADYAIRYGSPTIEWGQAYSTEEVVRGSSIGSSVEYEYTGLSAGAEYEFRLVPFRGTLDQDVEFGDLSNVVSTVTDGSNTAPLNPDYEDVPTPDADDVVLYDWRSGGGEDLQAGDVTAIGEAEAQADFLAVDEERGSPTTLGVTNTFLGDGTRAIVFPWVENGGADGCYGNGLPPDGSQQNLFLEIGNHWGSVGAGDAIVLQHKRYWGRTAADQSSAAIGNVDDFQHINSTENKGRKLLIWQRPNAPKRIFWMTRTTSPGFAFRFSVEDNNEMTTGRGHADGTVIQPWWPDANSPGGPYTFTHRIQFESSEGAGDGQVQFWVDDQLIAEQTGVHTYTDPLQRLELGGPTWICPSQDQTEYFWDVVVWKEN